MSHRFVAVQWNKRKIVYDLIFLSAFLIYFFAFPMVSGLVLGEARLPNSAILRMRGLGSAAFLLVSFILAIGPLARLFPLRFKPLLYNRRHLGVFLFFVGLLHAREVLGFYQAYGRLSSIEALFHYDSSFDGSAIPFQLFGVAALTIFCVMALTSHDYWQKLLGKSLWKSIHMGVYLAYSLVVAHVAFGAIADQGPTAHSLLYVLIALAVCGLHVLAGAREWRRNRSKAAEADWLDAGCVADLSPERPKSLLHPDGHRIALLLQDGALTALHAECAHQGGPLDEGRILDGCLTCPWHGWQYRAQDGQSPPPFEESVATYQVRCDESDRVQVSRRPSPLDEIARPCRISESSQLGRQEDVDFFVGYLAMSEQDKRRSLKTAGAFVTLFLLLGLALAVSQKPGGERLLPWRPGQSFRGMLLDKPYPQLRYLDEDQSISTIFLVAGGKSGTRLPEDLIGRPVEVSGLLLQRGESRMLASPEIRALEISAADMQRLQRAPVKEIGHRTLRGEVVDAKCFFGAMRPGQGQTHRGCAQICIEGGIPPFLAIFDDSGGEEHILLTNKEGEAINADILPFVAEPLEVLGTLFHSAGVLVLQFDTGSITRL